MRIVVVNGFGGSGKDTFEKYVIDYATTHRYKVSKTSMIEYTKEQAKKLGWTGGKTLADRRFLSDLKDSLTRWNDSPFNDIQNKIRDYEKNDYTLLFIDAREPEDIDRIKLLSPNVSTLLVKRQETDNIVYGNHADDCVLDYAYDWVIENNDSLDDLRSAAELWFERILEEGELVKLVDEDVFDRN